MELKKKKRTQKPNNKHGHFYGCMLNRQRFTCKTSFTKSATRNVTFVTKAAMSITPAGLSDRLPLSCFAIDSVSIVLNETPGL